MTTVIDASAILAILKDEPGAEVAIKYVRGALFSAVNLTEVLAKASDLGMLIDNVAAIIADMGVVIMPFDEHQAVVAGALRAGTRYQRISFADRACLALAIDRRLPVVTGDTQWTELDLAVDIRLIR